MVPNNDDVKIDHKQKYFLRLFVIFVLTSQQLDSFESNASFQHVIQFRDSIVVYQLMFTRFFNMKIIAMLLSLSLITLHPVSISLHFASVFSEMSRGKKLLLFCLSFDIIVSGLCIVGGRHSAVPPYDDPVVFVNHVGRFSRVEGFHNTRTGLYAFRGIKYADPPIRENRFLRPRLKRLSGDVDAKRNPPPCPQPDYYGEMSIRW